MPLNVFTDENKRKMLDTLTKRDVRRGTLVEEFDILAKRARGSATR